ncbi:uncharacterized protein ACLA_021290 [Aspergillus clavatus NRRL 1]|uniref:Acyl-protein thioesterase 1 n=1 Tax=Aspergillus clavatus (strain ATCC 1007 / CBS 513.65 / DSM 816 / NCTC 3887 / NRRL 1 / QM 1276 / 107) TaxID=344612 RepID=A1CP49_ASPCL|nr:uncharacterized protein ACLA_021290 [Aspergillus clavatus NRRL 1]EAW07420.1 conserved hypothetical protein [Aspergillus clavatus NRRL 1]
MVQLFPPRHVYFPSTPSHSCTVILLHDIHSTGPELAARLAMSQIQSTEASIFEHFPSCRWVFPSAQPRQTDTCQTIPGSWFESPSPGGRLGPAAMDGLRESVAYTLRIVDEEINRLAGRSRRVVLGGLGQGMAVAVGALLCARGRVGGFIGLNGWFPLLEEMGRYEGADDEEIRQAFVDHLGLELLTGTSGIPGPAATKAPSYELPDSTCKTPILLSYLEADARVGLRTPTLVHDMLVRLGYARMVCRLFPGSRPGERWLKDPEQLDAVAGFLAEVLGH